MAIGSRLQVMENNKSVFFLLTLSVFVVSSCAINQPSPPSGELPVSSVTVKEAQGMSSSTLSDNLLVRWGGTIARIDNRKDGTTLLEIVSRPLYGGGRPIHNDRSEGRFLAVINSFLDPEIVKTGRDITVLGRLEGLENGKIGESEYTFPRLAAVNYRYWKPRSAAPPGHFPHWYAYPYRRYDPFWDDWPFPPRRTR